MKKYFISHWHRKDYSNVCCNSVFSIILIFLNLYILLLRRIQGPKKASEIVKLSPRSDIMTTMLETVFAGTWHVLKTVPLLIHREVVLECLIFMNHSSSNPGIIDLMWISQHFTALCYYCSSFVCIKSSTQ